MLTREITYEDYNGNQQTDKFYFNVTKPEIVELEVEYKKGFREHLEAIIASEDRKEIIAEFKRLITWSYGEKSDDGKRFVKNPELTEAFTQHPAYAVLYMELATDYNLAGDFIIGIAPSDMRDGVAAEVKRELSEEEAAPVAPDAQTSGTVAPPAPMLPPPPPES